MSRYCRCERDLPYSPGPRWEVWDPDPDQAWCRRCDLDVHPSDARRTYAQACAALDYVETKWPELAEGTREPKAPWRRTSEPSRATGPAQLHLPGVEVAM